jgi:hypothetical protein
VLTGEDSYNKIHLTEHSSFTLKSESSRMLPFYDPNAFLMSFGFQLDILVFLDTSTFFKDFVMHLENQWS